MNTRVLKTIFVFMMVLSFLSSCATIEKIGGKKPQNSAERDIFVQAIAAGAVIGAVVGGVVGHQASKEKNKKENTAIGAAAGGAVGSGIGWVVANYQIENLRNIRLENDRLEALLNSARRYNQEVAAYNKNLQQQMARLKKKSKEEQARIAMDKKEQAEAYRAQLQEAIAERRKLSEKLVPEQKKQYQQTLKELEKEGKKLDKAIAVLDSFGAGTVG